MRSNLIFQGFSYRKNSERHTTAYYRCSKYDTTGCVARLIVTPSITKLKKEHTCRDNQVMQSVIEQHEILPDQFIESFIDNNASKLQMTPSQIYSALLIAMDEKYKETPYRRPTKNTIKNKIREIRGSIFHESIMKLTEPPLCHKMNGAPFFRRFWKGEIHGETHMVMIWATNECLSLMRYNSHTFIDGTFRSTPAPFKQCVIIMVYDHGTNSYVPCVYGLLTSKNEYLYNTLLH